MKTKQFTETLIDYIDGKVRRNNLTFKLTLGGGAGPGGGGGLPWNSIIGQLIQKRVAFDITMSASPCMDPASGYWLQSGSLLDNLNIIRYRQLPATWFETSPTDLRGLSVNVASGVWYDAENSYFIFSGGVSPTFTLPTVNPRIDVVYITPSGVIEIQQGTESPSPSITMPTASGVLPTWAVYLPPGASGVGYPCETYSGYLYQDLRPFIAYPPGGGGGGAVGVHTLLQTDVHTDTVTQVPNQGSIVLGNAAGKWDELTIGAAGTALISNGVTAAWGAYMPPVAGVGYAFISDGVDSWTADLNPIWRGMHLFENLALDTVDTCYVLQIDYIKSAGVTNAADDMAGIYSVFQFDQVGGTIGDLYGAYIEAEIANGTTGAAHDIWGIYTYVDLDGGTADRDVWGLQAKVYGHGTVVDEDIWGLDGWIDLNTGSVGGDVIGLSSWIDIAAGYTSPGSDVYGLYTYVDVNVAPAGTVYMLYLDEQDGIDYGVYQNGTSDNYLGGDLGVGDNAPACRIHAKDVICEIRSEYTGINNYGRFSIYEGNTWKAYIDVLGSTGAPAYLRNALAFWTNTGDIHLKPGSGNVGINLTAAPTEALDINGNIALAAGNTVDGLDLSELGEMFFDTTDGLLLLGPHCEINPTEWWTLRRQMAVLSGAFHQGAGRWIDTRGLVVETSTTNIILNPSLELAITGWSGFNVTPTRSNDRARFGDYSFKTVATGAGGYIRYYEGGAGYTGVAVNTTYTWSIWIHADTPGDVVQIKWWEYTAANAFLGDSLTTQNYTLVAGWQRLVVTSTTRATGAKIRPIVVNLDNGHTYYWDGGQVEQKGYPTTYCDGSLGAGYVWNGAVHNSTSTRTVSRVDLDALINLISSNNTLSFRTIVQAPNDATDAGWAAFPHVFDAIGANNNNRFLTIFDAPNDRFRVYINGGYRINTAALAFKKGDWLDIILTLDFTANSYVLYIDGVEVGSAATVLAAPVLTVGWQLGTDHNGNDGNQFGGTYAEYSVFDRVLTAVEVAQMYNLQRPLTDAGALTKPHGQFESVVTGRVVGAEGMLRGHGDIGGYIYWEGSVSVGEEAEIIPDMAGDVVYFVYGRTISTDRAGNITGSEPSNATPGAGNVMFTIFNLGGNTVRLKTYSTGRTTIVKTLGADRIYVNVWLLWQ